MIIRKRRHPSDAAKLHAVFMYEEVLKEILKDWKSGSKFKINRDIIEAIAKHKQVAYSIQTLTNFARMHARVTEAGITRDKINKSTFKKIKDQRKEETVNYGSPPQPDFLVDLLYTVRKVDENTYNKVKQAIENYAQHYDFTQYIEEAERLRFNNETTEEKIQKGEQLSAKLIEAISKKQMELHEAEKKIRELETENDQLRIEVAKLKAGKK